MRRSIPAERMPFVVTTRRDHVRYMATTRPAISMSKALRQAAALDPGLEWDADNYRYRLRRDNASPPPRAKSINVDGEGASKV